MGKEYLKSIQIKVKKGRKRHKNGRKIEMKNVGYRNKSCNKYKLPHLADEGQFQVS